MPSATQENTSTRSARRPDADERAAAGELATRAIFATAHTRAIRTLRRFAEEELVIPTGPFAGLRFNVERQPYTRLLLDAIDSGTWQRFAITGPTQSGKSLSGFVLPILYHLFEIGETVICGLPHLDMANDKWELDIRPAIERTRYRDLLPARGGGSRGGKVVAVRMGNGATLRFMSGGGSDKARAAMTSRVAVITEADGMDKASASSREADKITQIEARTRAYGARRRIYLECTVSIEDGRIWQEYTAGTQSRIALPCPHCREWVELERGDLVGWETAENVIEAREGAAFRCPACRERWSEEERAAANRGAQLLHAGQELGAAGEVAGEAPKTDTLGFRWSAAHNLLISAGDVAADEWRARSAADEDNAERAMRQFVWALPHIPSTVALADLEPQALMRRQGAHRRGIVPAETEQLTAALDLGKWLCHWILIAWHENATGAVVDYGRLEVPSDQLGVERGLMLALREFRDIVATGWPREGRPEELLKPSQVWIDSGYFPDVVYAFCRESAEGRLERYRPAVGRGAGQVKVQTYAKPKSTGAIVRHIGEGYHISWQRAAKVHLVEVNADRWKSWIHERLAQPPAEEGALVLFQADPREHMSIARHLTAERQVEEYVAGRGMQTRWERIRKNNHWFDAAYNAAAAAHLAGARLLVEERPKVLRRVAPRRKPLFFDREQPYLITER